MSLWVGVVAIAGAAAPAALAAPAAPRDAFFELGLRQFREGSFEEAVFSLDTAVRRLSERSDRKGLAVAYVHLGAAYVGLQHETAAQGKFREALEIDPHIRLAAEEFAARVLEVFEIERLRRAAAGKRRATRVFTLAGGVGAGVAVGIRASRQQTVTPENRAPLGAIGMEPEGQAIVGVTNVEFTGSAADPDGHPVSFSWEFSDGFRASGPVASHLFTSEGVAQVVLVLDDGNGGAARVTESVTVRGVSGAWGGPTGTPGVRIPYNCIQAASAFTCRIAVDPPPHPQDFGQTAFDGQLLTPRRVTGEWRGLSDRQTVSCEFDGELRLFDCFDARGNFQRLVRE